MSKLPTKSVESEGKGNKQNKNKNPYAVLEIIPEEDFNLSPLRGCNG